MSAPLSDDRATPQPPVLFVLLGASNLARAYRCLLAYLRRHVRSCPIEFAVAMGPGRGYCAEGGVFWVRYVPIAQCGALAAAREKARSGYRIVALVTDVGNDIMYGVPPEAIVEQLDRIIGALQGYGADVVVTTIHVDVRAELSELRYRLLRALFFPHSSLDYRAAARAVDTVNAFIRSRAGPGVHVVDDLNAYAGWDKIHYGLGKGHLGWTRIAGELLRGLHLSPSSGVTWPQMVLAVVANAMRVLFCDMLRLRAKRNGIFYTL